jgi:MFS family permease
LEADADRSSYLGQKYFYIDRKHSLYVHNWIEDLDLRCAEKWEIGVFGSSFFIGHVMGSTLLASYGDSIGRVPMMRVGQGITLVAYCLIVFFFRSKVPIYLLIFIMGLLSCWRLSLAFIYG